MKKKTLHLFKKREYTYCGENKNGVNPTYIGFPFSYERHQTSSKEKRNIGP